jgi:Ankyrin repeats (3 copies)
MANLRVISITALAVLATSVAVSHAQTPDPLSNAGIVAPGTLIDYVPPIARAVLTGDSRQVSEALDKEPESVNAPIRAKKGARAGFTPLILATALSDRAAIGMLLQRGAKIAILDDFHRSALWYAALREDVGTTEILVKAESVEDIINTADTDLHRTPLHLAVRGNEPEVVELLIQHGASKSESEKDILGDTPADYCGINFTTGCKYLK